MNKKFEIILNYCTNIPGMSPETLRKMAPPELEISNVSLFSVKKWVNEQSDNLTRNLNLFKTSVQTSGECVHIIWEKQLIQNSRYTLLTKSQQGRESINTLTNIQKIWNYVELLYKHCRKISRKFEKYWSSRTRDIQS